jgi:hypothetical protein
VKIPEAPKTEPSLLEMARRALDVIARKRFPGEIPRKYRDRRQTAMAMLNEIRNAVVRKRRRK